MEIAATRKRPAHRGIDDNCLKKLKTREISSKFCRRFNFDDERFRNFRLQTKKRICFLNFSPDEVIESIIYNRENDSLITLSLCASDKWSALICRSTSIEHIRRGQPDAGFRLFESESIGFLEFDDLNGKVILQCQKEKAYKVSFDLKNYTFLFSIIDKNVQGIEIRWKRYVAEALKDITAVFYDGERNEIYTSNKLGRIHVWTN